MVKGPAVLREINEKRVLAYIRANGTSSRQELTKNLGLSKNTVSLITEEFIKEGILREVGIDSKGVGRPRMKLDLIPDIYHSVGLHVRDTFCELVVTDYLGSIIESRKLMMNTQNAAQCLKEITLLWPKLESTYSNIIGFGIAIPGLVNPDEGIVISSSHLHWKDVNVIKILEKQIPVPIKVLNRVKAAALSPEKIIPEDADSTFYIRIDEGVGGAFVHNKDVLSGFNYTAGEVGHLVVKHNGPLCTCGQKGCLETLVSIGNVIRRLSEMGANITENDLYSNHFFTIYSFDPNYNEIVKVFKEVGKEVGTAVSTIINLFNPQFIVIDSPYNEMEFFKSATLATIKSKALKYPSERTNTIFASNPLSSPWGMAMSVIHQFEATNFV
ncbi:ROK family protein [Cytobacillus sp. Hz8]|uniref:ROK family transcriptional regulator n=1 Tax=Cytobacillus sp. Hz8 TaxID=3347168 RepID=UPI0035E0E825